MRERLTFANVVSCIALFVALGGSAFALKANSVGSRQIRNDSVRGQDVKNGSLKGKDLAAGSVGERELAPTPGDPNSIQMGSDLGTCDPNSTAYVQCARVVLNVEEPSRLMLTAGGGQAGTANAEGNCRFSVDNQALLAAASPSVGDVDARDAFRANGFALTAVRPGRVQPGTRVVRVVCNEEDGDVSFSGVTLSAVAFGDGLG